MSKRVAALSLLALLQAPHALASGDGLEQLLALSMEDLLALKVSISTHSEQTLSKAPSVVSIITAADIAATGASNLSEVLQGVPGVYVRANLFGFRPQVTMRGAAGTHTLVMVNGEPIRDLVWSTGIFSKGLPTSMIDRVEIIRGPGSALFGADASAGVINVITRTAGKVGRSGAGLRAGAFDSQTAWARHAGNWNGFDFALTADMSHHGGHDPVIVNSTQSGEARYGWEGRDFRASLGRGNWRLQADYMGRREVETGLTGAAVLDPVTRGKDNRYDLTLLYNDEEFSRHWAVNAELRYHDLDYSSGDGFQERPPGYTCTTTANCSGGTPGTYNDGWINRQRSAERGGALEASGLYTGLKHHALRLGGGFRWQDLYKVEHLVNYGTGPDGVTSLPVNGPLVNLADSPMAFAPKKRRETRYVYLQDIWSLAPDWELTAGARYDHYSDFGGSVNPRLALVWQGTERLTTKLMYGEAFRAPSFLELYSRTSATTPNPNLKPEQSRTWDLSFAYSAGKDLKLGLGLYRFSQSNLISTVASTFQNSGSRTSHGLELEAQWQVSRALRLSGNLAYIEEADATFPRSVPKEKAYLRADWAVAPGWHWNVQANWIGRRDLPAGDARAPLPAYTLLDTTLRHSRGANWEFAASLRNLFDVDAREYSSASLSNNLPLPGRGFHLEMFYRL